MKTEIYKGCKIRSSALQISNEGNYSHAVNGVIEIDSGSHVTNIMIQHLNIPNNEWKHFSEEDADMTFIKYGKIYIDANS